MTELQRIICPWAGRVKKNGEVIARPQSTWTPASCGEAPNPSGAVVKGTWMSNFLSRLTKSERARLLEEVNYMNLEEIRGFCSERAIPYRIVAEYSTGKVKATKDTDRKPIVLARVRRYLRTGEVGQPTCISVQIVREENPPARPGPRDRLYYRWYAKEFEGVMRLLRDLTAGRFRDGAVARVLASLPHRPPPPARRRRLEGLAQGQSEVRPGDARPNRAPRAANGRLICSTHP
jgi:hypothetical protein